MTRRSLTRMLRLMAASSPAQFPGSLGSGGTGFIGGGQAGYNWQTGAFVIGVETDFDGSTVGRDFHFSSTPFGGPVSSGAMFST